MAARKKPEAVKRPEKVWLVVPRHGGPVAYASWSHAYCRTWVARRRSTGDYVVIGPYFAGNESPMRSKA